MHKNNDLKNWISFIMINCSKAENYYIHICTYIHIYLYIYIIILFSIFLGNIINTFKYIYIYIFVFNKYIYNIIKDN